MIWLMALMISWAQAGYLQIVDEAHLSLQKHPKGLLLKGSYQFANQGNEPARHVYPELSLENFVWNGEAQDLEAGGKYTWTISEVIPANQLKLPLKGQFAFSVFKHYQDINGYPFAVPAVEMLEFEDTSETTRPAIEMKISADESNHFVAQVQMQSRSPQRQSFYPALLLPREVDLESAVVPLEVGPDKVLETSYRFMNHRGLIGSTYNAFFILTWVEDGTRKVLVENDSFKIQKPQGPKYIWSLEKTFWIWWVWLLLIGLIGMWAFWIRPLKKMDR